MMKGEDLVPMLPWWRGFNGTIKKVGDHKYDVTGIATKVNDTTIEITELPIHKWTSSFKNELEAMIGDKGEGTVKVSLRHLRLHVQFMDIYTFCRTTKNTTIPLTSISSSACLRRKSRRLRHRDLSSISSSRRRSTQAT